MRKFLYPLLTITALALVAGLTYVLVFRSSSAAETEESPREALLPTLPALFPLSTPVPSPTFLILIPTPTPTLTPEPSPTLPSLPLAATPYQHPEGLFEITPPEGWQLQGGDYSLSMTAPDHTSLIRLEVLNSGYPLDGQAFEQLIRAREQYLFSGYEKYEEQSYSMSEADQTAVVEKQLKKGGVLQSVTTFYSLNGVAVAALDFWVEAEMAGIYRPLYRQVLDSLHLNPEAVAEVTPYAMRYTFTGPDSLFKLQVPVHWHYQRDTSDYATLDTFSSPDNHAAVQTIVYNDGEPVSRSLAGAFVLDLLNNYYTRDVKVTQDILVGDMERLTWHSPGGDYSGMTYFKIEGNNILVFTLMYDNPFREKYYETLVNALPIP